MDNIRQAFVSLQRSRGGHDWSAFLSPGEDQNAGRPVSELEGQRWKAERPSGSLDVFGNVFGLADSEPGRHHE